MNEKRAKAIFDKYNPAGDVVRCPNGRAKVRKTLDLYARAAVNLYGIISREEFVQIFNDQNAEQTTVDEIYTLLLPKVLKDGWYGFYKNYLVHYWVLEDFEYVNYLEAEQKDKPRYVPEREEFLEYEWEDYEDNDYWNEVRSFMYKTFGGANRVFEGFRELKSYLTHSIDMAHFGEILEKYYLMPEANKMQKFLDLLTEAKNNSRIWENKGYSPAELYEILQPNEQSPEPPVMRHRKPKPEDLCPCGSGEKFQNCCAYLAAGHNAQLSYGERRLYYGTWYKLLDFVNQKLHITSMPISHRYRDYHDDIEMHKVRAELWECPGLIGEFIKHANGLTFKEIGLLQSWEQNHIKGNFVIVEYEPDHAILMGGKDGQEPRLYAVKGMTTTIAESMGYARPIMVSTVLLPFGDKIIYDGFMDSYRISFKDGARALLNEEFAELEEEQGITLKLNQ